MSSRTSSPRNPRRRSGVSGDQGVHYLDQTCEDIEYAASAIRQVEPAMITAVTLVY